MGDRANVVRVGDRLAIYQRGQKQIWVADFWVDGSHKRQSLKTSNRKVAVERATQLAASLICGTFQQPPPETTLKAAYDTYVEFHRTGGKAKKTLAKYTGILSVFIAFLADNRITKVSQFNAAWFDKFRAFRAPKLRPRTLYGTSNEVKQFFKWCRSRKLIHENPIADYRLSKPVLQPKEGPSLAQVNLILLTMPRGKQAMIAVLAFSGLRAGELQRLQPRDIDLAGNWIHVVSRDGLETKTRTSRKVPIHPRLRPYLEELLPLKKPWVFTMPPSRKYPKGDHWINYKRLNEEFQEVIESLKMPTGRDHGFTLHSLRRFFETHTVNSGIPQRVIDGWMGHQFDRSMAAVYYRLRDEDSQSFMQKVPFGTGTTAASAAKE